MSQLHGPRAGGARREEFVGTLAAFATYSIWGLFPLYWKRLSGVEALQVLAHRIVWAALFTLLLLALRRELPALLRLLLDARRLLVAVAAATLITVNWGIYIWAVNEGHVAESSLGYYINPLLSVALGAVFLRERLDAWTRVAVGVAAAGVLGASILLGSPPWISLSLAVTFAVYGLLKKKAGFEPIIGLAAETLAATPLALGWLLWRHLEGAGALGGPDAGTSLLLALAGPVTAVPLLTFAFATNRITLQRLGFIQYISPSSQLLLAVLVYRERVPPALALAFGTVIVAVLVYALTRIPGKKPG